MFASVRLTAGVLSSVVLLAGCGSTALRAGSVSQGGGGGQASDQGLGLPQGTTGGGGSTTGAAGLTAGGASTGLSSLGGVGGGSGSGGAGTSGSGAAGSGTATSGSAGTGGSRSATTSSITVGVVGVDPAAIAAAFGSTKSAGDIFASSRSMIAYVNKRGGINGRKLKAVYVTEDISKDSQQAGQDACSKLTEDNKVDIVLSQQFSSETLYACLKARGISIFNAAIFLPDAQFAAQYPNHFLPGALRADRYAPAAVETAVKQGGLKKGDKLGVLIEDCPWGLRVYNDKLVPVAKKLGVSIEIGSVKCINNLVQDITPLTNDIQRNVLKFNSDSVTHVIAVSGAEGFILDTFTNDASQQHYLPKYIIASSSAHLYNNSRPDAKVRFSPDAMPNMIGTVFRPWDDFGNARAKPANSDQVAAQARCKAADPNRKPDSDPENEGFAKDQWFTFCDAFFGMVDTLTIDGAKLDLASISSGYHAMLSRSAAAGLAGGHYSAGQVRVDGVGLVQPIKYDVTAKRFVPDGGTVAVP